MNKSLRWGLVCVCMVLLSLDARASVQTFCGFSSKTTATKIRCSRKKVGGLEVLRSFPHLAELNFTRSGLEDLTPLPAMPTLRVLSLNYTPVRSLLGLQVNPSVTELDASNTRIRDLQGIESLSLLRNLTLWNVKVSDLKPLASLSRLESLVLGGTSVQDLEPLKGLKLLQVLNLERTSVETLAPLIENRKLNMLFLSGTDLTRAALQVFRAARPDIKIVGCKGTSSTPCALVRTPKPSICRTLTRCCRAIKDPTTPGYATCAPVEETLEKLSLSGGDATKLMVQVCTHTLRALRPSATRALPKACKRPN